MTHNLVPSYLSSLIPSIVGDTVGYSLRNANHISTVHARTQLYFNSFLPSTLRAWNELPLTVRNLESLILFKKAIFGPKSSPPNYYNVGTRQSQILHCRLRTGCSSLNADLFSKNVVDSPLCQCRETEDTFHFFFKCPKYSHARSVLFNSISSICAITLWILLYGDASLSFEDNACIFTHVHKYIIDTSRFTGNTRNVAGTPWYDPLQ